MSAPDPPPDYSMQIRQMEIEESRRKEEKEAREKQLRKEELSGLRSSSRSAASGSARQYFSGRGVDPDKYGSDIESELNSILAGIDPEESNPGMYFKDAGANIYGNLETGRRTKMQDQLSQIFGQNYETERIPFTLDDPYLSGIESEQYQTADDIIRNMMDRGVLTGTGGASARQDLEKQRAGVRSRLNEIGTGVLSGGQQKLRDIAGNARESAGTLTLGQQFDPNSYGGQADSVFDEFISTLGDQIRGRITGPLFSTAGLAAIGGAGQGAGNTAYNPDAANGIFDDEEEEETPNPDSLF